MQKFIGLVIASFTIAFSWSATSYAQNYRYEQKSSGTYVPSGDGVIFNWEAGIRFDVYMGEPTRQAEFVVTYKSGVKFKGKTYNANDVPENVFKQLSPGPVNIAADIYSGASRVSTVTFTNVISFDIAGSPNWGSVFPGLSGEQEKALYRNGFSIRNIRISNTPSLSGGYAMESWIKESQENERYNQLIQEADQLFSAKRWDSAKAMYKEAQRIKYSESYPRNQIELIDKELMKQEKDEDYKRLIDEGDKLLAQGDLAGAQSKYEQAQRLNPDNLQAERGLAQVEEAKKKVEEEAEAAEKEEKRTNEEEEDDDDSSASEKSANSDNDQAEAKRESEAQRRAREEYERQQRKLEYDRNIAEQRKANMQTAAQASSLAIQAIMWTAGIIYKGVGRDNNINLFKGDSYFLGFEVGFATSLFPMYTNSRKQSYNGNTYSYRTQTENHQTWTFDLQGSLEFWPVFGRTQGFGVFGSAVAGANIFMFEHTLIQGEYGFRGFVGHKAAKLFGEYSRGTRVLNHSPWIDPKQSGSGKAKYDYQRIKLGARFSFDGNFMGPTTMHLDLLPMFELPSFKTVTSNNTPFIFNWNPGIHIGFWAQNRLRFFGEMTWGLTRTGEQEYNLSGNNPTGYAIRVGVIRRIDLFGNGAYQYNQSQVTSFLKKKNKWGFSFGNPTVDWAAVKDSSYFNNRVNLSSQWFLIEKDINIIPNISGVVGVAMSGPRGAILKVNNGQTQTWNGTTYPAQSEVRLAYLNASIPVGIRLMTSPMGHASYWLRGSYVNKFNFLHGGIYEDAVSGDFELYMMAVEGALGVDVSLGPKIGLRLGAVYQHDLKPLSDTYQIKSRSLYVQLGIII